MQWICLYQNKDSPLKSC